MEYVEWNSELDIEAPIYLDANIIVGAVVRNHPLYESCAKLTAKILIAKADILVSMVQLDESLWAIAKLCYCDINNHPMNVNTHWTKKTYKKWCEKIFSSYEGWITAPGFMIKEWSEVGVPVEVIPKTEAQLNMILEMTSKYMRDFKLTPADAIHLATAQSSAKTFITADSDFKEVSKSPPEGDLVIVDVKP